MSADHPPEQTDALLDRLRSEDPTTIIEARAQGFHRAVRLRLASGLEVYAKSSVAAHIRPSEADRMVRNEAAAYEINRMLGLDLVPPTVLRDLPAATGQLATFSVCLAVDGDENGDIARLHDDDIALAALLDTLFFQLDRLKRNWLIRWDPVVGRERPVLIDHGFCFDIELADVNPDYDLTNPRSIFIEEAKMRGLPLPTHLLAELRRPENVEKLLSLLPIEAVLGLLVRLEEVDAA